MARVLIAEDEAFTAMALVDLLEDQGHTVRDAADGLAAVDVARTFQPDILVTDLMMPRLDGAELIRQVRAQAGRPIPVILITGVTESKLPEDIAYDAYLGKPIDYVVLCQLVERLTQP